MSDNIDYAELDKAVNEAIKSTQTARPVAKSTPKPVVKNTTAPRPHGQFMDFVRRPAGVPAAHPVARPVVAPTVKTTTTVAKPAARPVAHPVAKPATRPVAHPAARPVAKPVAKPAAPVHPTVHHAVATHPNVAAQIQQRQAKLAAKPATPAAKPVAKPAAKPVAKPAEKPVVRKATEDKAPNANNYSLGGRSPFLTDAKVEKHPLGKNIPETSSTALKSTKNTYSQKAPSKTAHHAKKHVVTEAPKKHTGWLWALVVLFVLAAGGGLGYLAYILVFAGGF